MEIKIISGQYKSHNKESDQIYVIDFGDTKQYNPVKVSIEVKGVTSSELISTCRCSVSTSDTENIFNLEYIDNNVISAYVKTFQINYVEGGKNLVGYLKIKGNIIR